MKYIQHIQQLQQIHMNLLWCLMVREQLLNKIPFDGITLYGLCWLGVKYRAVQMKTIFEGEIIVIFSLTRRDRV